MRFLLTIPIIMLFFTHCTNSNRQIKNEKNVITDTISCDTPQNTEFEHTVSSINIIELPDTIFCGVDRSISLEEYGAEIEKIAPKPSEWTSVYGKLPARNKMEYIIYAVTGDINYPYLFVYNKNGQLIDSVYLHIGYCLGDESVTISNVTVINADYSIQIIDTTKYVHYNEDNQRFVDSVIVTTRKLAQNTASKYQIIYEEHSKQY